VTLLHFDTGVLPAEQRLPIFAASSPSYTIEAVGDPLAFSAQCVAARIGEVNVMRARISPVRYRRTPAQIERDGEDRLVLFYILAGRSAGTIDGRPVAVGPGEAMIWDLSRPLDITSLDGVDTEAITLPRFMVEEVMPGASVGGPLTASPAMAMVVAHLRFLLDHAGEMPAATLPFQARALRDMVVTAHYPTARTRTGDDRTVPMLQRLFGRIDRQPGANWDIAALAAAVGGTVPTLCALLDRFGGVEAVVERRRLLAAYRMLCDPAENANISVIAARCGFTNMPRFSRQFHAAFRTSARDLRTHHRAELPTWAGAYHLDRAYAAIMVG
jgi:AraC-like DNA-binding protein